MKIVLAHSFYRQPGGEEGVFRAERELLEGAGHEVRTFTVANDEMVRLSRIGQAAVTIWNRDLARTFRRFLQEDRPDVVHFHNTFPFLSPAAIRVASEEGIKVVQTLHNYRLLCANGLLLRDGRVCELCVGKAVPWPGVAHACYRESRAASAAVATMLVTHRALGTWTRHVDRFIALTEFARRKYIEGGLPADRIVVKPNFVPDPGPPSGEREDFGLFVGRLSPEKGIATLLRAWRELPGLRLVIVGAGPLEGEIDRIIAETGGGSGAVTRTGPLPQGEVLKLMRRARFLVLPSEWYEGAPRVILEAFACGLPVVASRLGSMAEMIEHGRTGLHFTPSDSADLALQIRTMLDDRRSGEMARNARQEYERKYRPEENHDLLMAVYGGSVDGKG